MFSIDPKELRAARQAQMRAAAFHLFDPDISLIDVGWRTLPATAVALDTDEGAEIFARYATRHRLVARFLLPRVMGFEVDGSEADFREAGRHMPFVRFIPRSL